MTNKTDQEINLILATMAHDDVEQLDKSDPLKGIMVPINGVYKVFDPCNDWEQCMKIAIDYGMIINTPELKVSLLDEDGCAIIETENKNLKIAVCELAIEIIKTSS